MSVEVTVMLMISVMCLSVAFLDYLKFFYEEFLHRRKAKTETLTDLIFDPIELGMCPRCSKDITKITEQRYECSHCEFQVFIREIDDL